MINCGTIEYGEFYGKVAVGKDGDAASKGNIAGGTFKGEVEAADAATHEITGGTFENTFTLNSGKVTGGTFNGTVVVNGGQSEAHLGAAAYNGLIRNNSGISKKAKFFNASNLLGIVENEPISEDQPYYKVIFDTDGGTMEHLERYFLKNGKISDKIEPTRTGYFFTGWYDGDSAWDHAADTVKDEMTLMANWTACDHSGHTGAQPTCTDEATCTECGGTISALGHDWGEWTANNDDTHTRICTRDNAHAQTEDCADVDKDHLCDHCGKVISEHTGGEATCIEKAICEICGESYGELDANNHSDLVHVSAKAATKDAEGNIEYWYCNGCGKYFGDAAAAKEINKADTVIKKSADDKKQRTGDNGNMTLWLALIIISGVALTGAIIVGRKRMQFKK